MSWSYTLDGLAVALEAQRPGDATRFSRISTDTRTLKEGDVFFALKGDRFDGHDYVKKAFEMGAAAAVVSETVHGGVTFRVENTLDALQQFAAWHRKQHKIPVIAITGSCGKTSTKDMIASVLAMKYRVVKTQGNLNNEIGLPQSLLQIDSDTDIAVMEMGANHKGEIARLCTIARPTESLITLVAPAHLEGFGSIEDVAQAKGEIADGLGSDGLFYVNVDNDYCRRIGEQFDGKKVYVGDAQGDWIGRASGERVILDGCRFDDAGSMVLDVNPIGRLRLPLHAKAHALNVLFAVAIGLRHGIEEFETSLREACLRTSRFKVSEVGPLTVIDDSYNANPASMKASLEALRDRPGGGQRLAALGTMLEMGPESRTWHQRLGEWAAQCGMNHVFTYGPEAETIAAGARAAGAAHANAYTSHEAIADAIREVAGPRDVLLVKGSRGMTMEKVIEPLKQHYAKAGTEA